MSRPAVHAVDASPLAFRAWFSLPPTIVDPEGRPANAVRGFASSLLRLLETERPTHVAVAFDESLTTCFRNEIHPGYKASRPLPPDELVHQLGVCRTFVRALGIVDLADARYEADDLIATVVELARSAGAGAVVVSPDKDLAALVSPEVELLDAASGRRWDVAAVRERLGVRPDQVEDWLALAGDPVDDIPGVAGIGPKRAAALLEAFDDLDAVFDRIDEVRGLPLRGAAAVERALTAGRDAAFLSRRLARLVRDAPLDLSLASLAWRRPERDALAAALGPLGLGQLTARALAAAPR